MPENIPWNENEALVLLAQGDAVAFKKIYDRCWPSVYKVAYRYLQSAALAEDVVQEIFSKIWLKRTEFTEVRHLDFYVITMTKNLAYKYLKRLADEAVARREFVDQLEKTNNNVESAFLDKQYKELLDQAVDLLPPQRKHIFHLAKVEGMSHEAIAEKLKISPNTVKNQMVAALQFIRHRLQHYISSFAWLTITLADKLFG